MDIRIIIAIVFILLLIVLFYLIYRGQKSAQSNPDKLGHGLSPEENAQNPQAQTPYQSSSDIYDSVHHEDEDIVDAQFPNDQVTQNAASDTQQHSVENDINQNLDHDSQQAFDSDTTEPVSAEDKGLDTAADNDNQIASDKNNDSHLDQSNTIASNDIASLNDSISKATVSSNETVSSNDSVSSNDTNSSNDTVPSNIKEANKLDINDLNDSTPKTYVVEDPLIDQPIYKEDEPAFEKSSEEQLNEDESNTVAETDLLSNEDINKPDDTSDNNLDNILDKNLDNNPDNNPDKNPDKNPDDKLDSKDAIQPKPEVEASDDATDLEATSKEQSSQEQSTKEQPLQEQSLQEQSLDDSSSEQQAHADDSNQDLDQPTDPTPFLHQSKTTEHFDSEHKPELEQQADANKDLELAEDQHPDARLLANATLNLSAKQTKISPIFNEPNLNSNTDSKTESKHKSKDSANTKAQSNSNPDSKPETETELKSEPETDELESELSSNQDMQQATSDVKDSNVDGAKGNKKHQDSVVNNNAESALSKETLNKATLDKETLDKEILDKESLSDAVSNDAVLNKEATDQPIKAGNRTANVTSKTDLKSESKAELNNEIAEKDNKVVKNVSVKNTDIKDTTKSASSDKPKHKIIVKTVNLKNSKVTAQSKERPKKQDESSVATDQSSKLPAPNLVATESNSSTAVINDYDAIKDIDTAQLNLDLVDKYLEVGEYESAKHLVQEVIDGEATQAQKSTAKEILSRLY